MGGDEVVEERDEGGEVKKIDVERVLSPSCGGREDEETKCDSETSGAEEDDDEEMYDEEEYEPHRGRWYGYRGKVSVFQEDGVEIWSKVTGSSTPPMAETPAAPQVEARECTTPEKKIEAKIPGVQFILLIGAAIEKMVLTPEVKAGRGRFEGRSTPAISISLYLKRCAKYLHAWKRLEKEEDSTIGVRSIVFAMLLLNRCLQMNPDFHLTNKNVHRLCLVAVLISVKCTEDVIFPTSFWARVGGIKVKELVSLELEFLEMTQFRVHVTASEFENALVRFKEFM